MLKNTRGGEEGEKRKNLLNKIFQPPAGGGEKLLKPDFTNQLVQKADEHPQEPRGANNPTIFVSSKNPSSESENENKSSA
jgi:hypothetical protein